MLYGSHEIRFDEAGRIVIPSRFRADFGESVLATPAVPDRNRVLLFSVDMFESLLEQAARRLQFVDNHLDLLRMFSSEAYPIKLDKAGRILIPDKLRKLCGLTSDDATVVGMVKFAELWDTAAYEEWRIQSRGRAAAAEATNLLGGFAFPGIAATQEAAE